MLEIGDRVKVIKGRNSWGWGSSHDRFIKKVGEIVKINQVTPSKRVPDGIIYTVKFQMHDKKTGKIGINQSFPEKSLAKLEK